MPRPPTSTLFPYTTLFRSRLRLLGRERAAVRDLQVHDVEVPLGGALQRDVLGDLAVVLHAAPVLGVPRRHHRHPDADAVDRKSTRLNSSHTVISYAVFCLK